MSKVVELGNGLYAVEVPEGTEYWMNWEYFPYVLAFYNYDSHYPLIDKIDMNFLFEIVGLSHELTEEQARELVESNQCTPDVAATCPSDYCKKYGCAGEGEYFNYHGIDCEPTYSALESLRSLLESKSLTPDSKQYLIIQKIEK